MASFVATMSVFGTTEAQRGARGTYSLPGRVVDVSAGEFFFQSPETLPAGLTTFRLRQIGRVSNNTGLSIAHKDSLALLAGDPTHGFHMLWIVRHLAPGRYLIERTPVVIRARRTTAASVP